VIWLGWMVFYGSFVLAGVFAVMSLSLWPIIVPREERGLEVRLETHIANSAARHRDGSGKEDVRTNRHVTALEHYSTSEPLVKSHFGSRLRVVPYGVGVSVRTVTKSVSPVSRK
jgi:hypothetical protein